MSKVIKFNGTGTLEFYTPSKSTPIKLKHDESMAVDFATERDIKVFNDLRSFGLFYSENEKSSKKKVEEIKTEIKESAEVKESPKYSEKELMSKTSAQLKDIAKELGVEIAEDASKREITSAILAK